MIVEMLEFVVTLSIVVLLAAKLLNELDSSMVMLFSA